QNAASAKGAASKTKSPAAMGERQAPVAAGAFSQRSLVRTDPTPIASVASSVTIADATESRPDPLPAHPRTIARAAATLRPSVSLALLGLDTAIVNSSQSYL